MMHRQNVFYVHCICSEHLKTYFSIFYVYINYTLFTWNTKKSTLIVGITIGTLLEVPNLVLPDYDLKIMVAKLTLIY